MNKGFDEIIAIFGIESKFFLDDVSKEEEVNRMVGKILSRFGYIYILVNNTGMNRNGVIHRGNFADWEG